MLRPAECPHTVTVKAASGLDARGKPSLGSSVSVRAMFQLREILRVNDDGTTRRFSGEISFPPSKTATTSAVILAADHSTLTLANGSEVTIGGRAYNLEGIGIEGDLDGKPHAITAMLAEGEK